MTTVINFVIKNYKWILAFLGIILVCAVIGLIKENNRLKEEKERLERNEVALTTEVTHYKTESGKNAAKVLQLEMTVDEFKQTSKEQVKIIEDLNLKIKRLESISTSVTNTNVGGKTQLKDTVYVTLKDSIYVQEKAKTFVWSDAWNRIEGKIVGKDVDCSYSGIDTLTIVANRVPKKFLFFRFGTKYIEINIVNSNPSTNIIYNRTVKFKK